MRPEWRRGPTGAVGVVTLVVAVLCSACTGIPRTSRPQTIEQLRLGEGSAEASIAPPADAQPRVLVNAFLAASAVEAGKHASARAFLTPAARNKWSDSTVTIVDGESVGLYQPGQPVQVTGRVLGTVNAAGIYTPMLQGTGDGGANVPFLFGVKKVDGQYRIDTLRNGLVITTDQFQSAYQRRTLYFFDSAERYLVPDPRWSALTDPTQLGNWLVDQLAAGPRPELQNAVNTDTLPAQANTRRLAVTSGTPTRIEIPGAAQLDSRGRNRLAAQLGQTLNDTVASGVMRITDAGKPIRIPRSGATEFTASMFGGSTGPDIPAPDVYYLRSGRVVDENGERLAGPLGAGTYYLTSVALSRAAARGPLAVAGVQGSGTSAQLLVGTVSAGLHQSSVHGLLSRPAWAPGRDEVWIGAGSRLYRVGSGAEAGHANRVSIPSGAGGGRIIALRLSPDGSRIGLVISGAHGSRQLYVGSIVRTAGQVRVDTLEPISPEGVVVTDLAWIDSEQLFAIGYNADSQDARVFETGVDGSLWTARGINGLPGPPDSLTVAVNQLAWVSANGAVWVQSGSSWTSAGVAGQTAGLAPVYLE